MAVECPGCRAEIDVEPNHGWPYIRSAITLHLDVCPNLHCRTDQRSICAEAIADQLVEEGPPFRCPFHRC